MGLSQDLQVCDGYLPVWLSHHSCVINCYVLMFLFCSHEYFAHTCVCTQLGMLGAPKKPKGGIGFPLELEFQIIPTSVNGWATRGVDCYTFCSEKGEHVEFENFDYQARKEALLRIFWPKWLKKYSYDNGGLGKPHLAECFGSLTEDVSKRCFRSGRPVVVRIKWK